MESVVFMHTKGPVFCQTGYFKPPVESMSQKPPLNLELFVTPEVHSQQRTRHQMDMKVEHSGCSS